MESIYQNGTYNKNNPGWHTDDSPWKAKQILKLINSQKLKPRTVCDIGCGTGEILEQLCSNMPGIAKYYGYEISQQAYELCKKRTNPQIDFFLTDQFENINIYFDLMLIIDVLEHVEDCFGFLRKLKYKSEYKIFHIPLDISVQSVIRKKTIMKWRQTYGHLHYFTKDTALAILRDTNYQIIDCFYAPGSLELPNRNIYSRLLEIPRRLLFALNRDFTVRLLGGFSLMVLAK